jgi:hypothetical protein
MLDLLLIFGMPLTVVFAAMLSERTSPSDVAGSLKSTLFGRNRRSERREFVSQTAAWEMLQM